MNKTHPEIQKYILYKFIRLGSRNNKKNLIEVIFVYVRYSTFSELEPCILIFYDYINDTYIKLSKSRYIKQE